MPWFLGPYKWAWIAYMVILTVIGEIVLFKGMKIIDKYFEEEEKKKKNNQDTDSHK